MPEVPVPQASPTASQNPSETLQGSTGKLYLRLILVGILVIIILLGYIIIADQPQTIIPSGTVIPLNCCGVGQHNATYPFSVSRPSTLFGEIQPAYLMTYYLMTSSQYANFTAGEPFDYLSGYVAYPINRLVFSQFLSEGRYYLIFETFGRVNMTLTVTVSVTLTHL